ncbi:ParB N-terminal domain-containing protein [Sphingobium sp. AS12]|uniref:ParB N-terminal domain-containing protein n=1 Tax=Sphingobium sp. AS12 TaxID=2849495 RepID=UPI001C313CAD|nr:ParB N-terminal domain-containing protein [Sphingobium sp. AS12]MBV2149047.1 ParB N-terminal domain-containing protein [Sphingobium sp. AS12]
MYMSELEVRKVSVDDIFLDPNNPRFWSEQNTREIPDRRIPDEKVQATARTNIDRHGIDDLFNSILRNGFLLLDRIVVRSIEGHDGKYVVVEGNRRFRSLTKLRTAIKEETIAEEGIDDDYLARLLEETTAIEVLIYKGSGTDDISWMLQGIRHISGIRDWEPAQRAKLVAKQIDDEGKTFRAAGQQFGLSPQAVGRLYRTYKALEQMRADDEFGGKARNDYFSLFEEAYRNTTLREWLGWDEEQRKFTNEDRIKRFYSWVSPDDEHEDKARRIHNPKQIKELAYLIENQKNSLITEFENHETGISEAYGRATSETKPQDWRKAVERARTLVGDLPQSAIFDDTKDFIAELERLSSEIDKRLDMARKQLDE